MTDFTESGLKYMGQETFVFKAFSQDVLSPGYPMYICAPESCCAHVEPKKNATTAAHMLRELIIFEIRGRRSVNRCGGEITVAVSDIAGSNFRRMKMLENETPCYKA
jgi:hypothetical protein